MCCCLKISSNLISNLYDRVFDAIMDLIYCKKCVQIYNEDSYLCSSNNNDNDHERIAKVEPLVVEDYMKQENGHNVIYDTIELQNYYQSVDRLGCEKILKDKPDGACLVRPFKFKHPTIKYILSIYAKLNYFHLYIRQTQFNDLYALGLEKSKEKLFKFPSDIITYYRDHRLQCKNEMLSINLNLRPIEA